MRCASCQHDNREGRRFCSECGAELPRVCPECSFVNEAGEKFCGGCGQPLGAVPSAQPTTPSERRPVTILFADLAGYTRLSSSLDPEETHHLLERFFEAADGAVLRYGGSIDKHIGDNVMAIFGAPIAHGNDPERAVRAALDVHAAVAQVSRELGVSLRVHIGIASGEVMASGLGSSHHQEYTVTGDAVNLAARLQDRATAGETMVSDAVRRATEAVAIFESVGEMPLKGLPAPVAVWKVVGLRASREPGQRRAFVGRRTELRHIQTVLEGCLDEGRGTAICVRGEAGLGKTRLLAEVRASAEHLGFRCQQALVLDFGVGAGAGAAEELTRGLLGLGDLSSDEERRAAVGAAVEEGLVADEYEPLLHELIGLVARGEERRVHDELDHAARAELRVEALMQLVDRLSRRQPLFLAVEDIHWADRSTLRCLSRLSELVGRCRAVLYLTTRVEGDPIGEGWRTEAAHSALLRIDLAPLRGEEALALALAGEGPGEASELTRRCIERAAGNPLFLEQLLEGGEEGERLPATVSSLVLSRVDRLPRKDKSALQVASVLGQRFELGPLRELLGAPEFDCEELLARQLLRRDERAYLFHHALIRDAVYASLTRARREELHREAARWYAERDAVLHAEHLELAGAPAARAYLRAAQELVKGYHYERAGALLEHAVDLAQSSEEAYELASLRGQVGIESGAGQAAAQAFERALGVAADDRQRCAALIGAASAHRLLSSYEPLLAALERAEPIAMAHDLAAERAKIHYLRGSAYFALGRNSACLREHELALEQALRDGDPEWQARARSGLGDGYYATGQLTRAREHYAHCIALCEAHGLERFAAPNRFMYAFCDVFRGHFAEALDVTRRALATTLRTRDRSARIFGHHALAMTELLLGNFHAARHEAALSLELAQRLGARRFEAEGMLLVALCDDALGRSADAEKLLEQAVVSARGAGLAYCGPMALGALAAVTGDSHKAREALEEGERLIAAGSLAHNSLWFAFLGLRFAVRERDRALVERYSDWLSEFAERDGLSLCEQVARAARLALAIARDPHDDTLRKRRQSLAETARESGLALAWLVGA